MEFNETLKEIKTYEAGKPIELVVRDYGGVLAYFGDTIVRKEPF